MNIESVATLSEARMHGFWHLIGRILLVNLLAGVPLVWGAYKLGPNDIVHMSVFDYEDMTVDSRVSVNGGISVPLLGEVQVAGLTTAEAEKKIATLLTDQGYIRQPQVSVMVREYHSQQVAVLGSVNKPGRFALDTEHTVTDLIASAGGVTVEGDDRIIIRRVREGQLQRLEVDLKGVLEVARTTEDMRAQGGDVIFVPRAPIFYIYGAVQRPGSYRLERGMTVAQALSVGGGLTYRGSENNITVQRNGDNRELGVKLKDTLQKDDVVNVGERWF